MAHGIHGNGGGGKSSGGSSSSSGGGKSSSGGGRKYVSPIPKLNYSTTDKSSARGRGNESYLRQDIADQKANGGSVNDRNFLAETVEAKAPDTQQSRFSEEANNGERRSNNEYRKQQEKKYSTEANDIGRYGEGNIDLHDRNTGLHDENGNLMTVRSMSFNEDGKEILVPTIVKRDGKWTQLSDVEAIDWYHKTGEHLGKFDSIEEANKYADRLHKQQESLYVPKGNETDQHADNYRSYLNEADRLTVEKTNSEGLTTEEQDEYDRRIQEAKDKAEEERKAAGIKNAKDKWDELRSAPLLSEDEQEAWAFLQPNEDVENQVGGWGRQYAAGPAMAVGTALEWFDKASDDMARYEYDQEHGEGAYDRAIAGKNVNQIGQLGNKLWDTGVGLQESGQQMWEAGTADMSELGREIANVAKTGTDVVGDIALNSVLPGLGTMRMYMGAAGNSAYEQSQRENSDVDSRMVAAVKGGLSAYLSNKLVGGLDAAYGESILGKQIHGMLGKTSPEVQQVLKPLLNTEGIEEGLEDILNYAADQILGLDTGKPLDWNEVKQDAFIGYVLGVLTNGLAGGMNIDNKMRQNIAKGGIEFADFAEQGGTIEEAAEIGRQNTRDQVVLKASPEAKPTAETISPAPQPAQDSTGTAWTGDWDSWVNAALSGGALSDTDINTIYNRPEARRAFEELKNISLDGMSEEDAKSYIGMAAGTQTIEPTTGAAAEPEATAATEPTAEPEQTTAETNANEMPLAAEPTQEANDTAGEIPNQEQANTNENPQQTQQSRPLNEEPPEQRREKISQYFTNTLTESGRAEGLDPITYNPTSEAESLTNAAMRLKEDYLGALDNLMKSPAWDGEMVDSAWMIENELFKQWEKTGDRYALDAWKRIETHKISQTAKGLQAVAKQSRPGAAAVLNAITNEISDIRQANAEAKRTGNTKNVVSEEVLTKAEEKANDIARRMAHLENEIDDATESGLSREEAQAKVKEDYLDLIDEINVFRHTGFIQDAKTNAQMRKSAEKLNTKFRKMLAGEDMDYIQRFAACDAAGIAEDVHYEGKQDFLKRLNTWQKLAQLTGTGTWLRNGVGNGSFGIVDVVSANNPVTWLTDMLVSKKTGKRASAVEAGILNKNAWSEAAHALHRSMLEIAANIDLATDTDQTKYDMSRTRTYDPDGNALQRTLSRWEQWNGYMLQSSDAWFKGAAEGSVRDALIRANGWDADSLTAEQKAQLDEAAKQVAEYRTFQNNSTAAEAANKLRDGINKLFNKNWKQGQFGVGTALMPYTKVPTNLAVKSFEFSPAGAVNGLREVVKVMRDPNATMAQQNKAVTDFGRGVTGTMLIYALSQLIKKYPFFRDWDAEDNLDVKAQNKAEGKYGMQLNLSLIQRAINGEKDTEWRNGDRTVDISSMEPLNQLITTASLIAEPEELDARTIGNAFYKSTRDSALGMPALQTLANIENTVKYTDTPDDGLATLATTLGSTVGNVAGGMIPGPIKHATTAADPFVRDTSGNNAIERSVNQAKSAVPGLRTTLPVKRDAFGNVMTSGDVGTRIANQYSPFKHSQVNQSDVSRELEKVREATDEVLVPARNPVKKVTYSTDEGKQEIKFSNKDAKDYQALVGKEQELRLKELFDSDLYKNSTPALKAQMIQEVEKYAKDTGKTALAEAFDISFDSDYKDVRNLKDPVDFLMTKTGYNAVTKAEKWDSVDALLKTVRQGKLSDKELDFYEDHIPGFKKMYSMAGSGVGSQRVMDFADALKTQYEGEKRADARGSDYIKVLGSGKFTAKEADALMDYAPDVKQSTIDKYHEQVNYQLKKAGMSGSSAAVWKGIEQVVNGQMEKSAFNKWVNQNVPLQQRQEIKDICSNYAKDRHEAGKTVSSIYKSVREAGFTPQQALEFYEAIDKNYNGSMTKKEYKNALRKVFGNKDGERIWNNMRKHGVQYVTGRF